MDARYRHASAALAALIMTTDAAAEWRCDCTSIVASCQASAVTHESFVEVTTDVAECARVDYLIDGIPFVALVVDGSERQDWIAQSASPDIIVQSCQVCLDGAAPAAAAAEPAAAPAPAGEPMLLIATDPAYPAAAMAAGIEGYVDVRFSLSPTGTVVAPEVVAADPAGVFDAAAVATVSRWRYTAPGDGATTFMTERVRFNLDDAIFALGADASASDQPAAMPGVTRNACVREQHRYDFGARVDITLINACAEPLLVFACSAGTGASRDRWTCRNPEQPETWLVADLPTAAGSITGDGIPRRSERLEISRAPNSEYWWLACAAGDTDCRNDGRLWVSDLDGQAASVDPRDRSRTRLARSY